MKSLVAILLATLVFSVPTLSFAKKNADGTKGKVTKVDEKSITVDNKKSGDSKTFTVDANTKIKIDDADGKITDVKVGDKVAVTAGDKPDVAATITVSTKKKAKKTTA
jgi:uncharacterized protein DUF5666